MLGFQPEPRGRVGWSEVGGNSHLRGAQGVAALFPHRGLLAQVAPLASGHMITGLFMSRFLFFPPTL